MTFFSTDGPHLHRFTLLTITFSKKKQIKHDLQRASQGAIP